MWLATSEFRVLQGTNRVDPGGIGPPSRQCECRVIPLDHGPI